MHRRSSDIRMAVLYHTLPVALEVHSMIMKKSSITLLGSLAIMMIGSEARANFVTHTVSTNGLIRTNSSMTLSVPAFDSSMGTLTSVVLSSSDSTQMSATLRNNSSSLARFTVKDVTTFGLGLNGNMLLTDSLQATKDYVLSSGGTGQFGQFNLAGSSQMTIDGSNSALLAQFIGSSNVNFNYTGKGTFMTSGFGGNLFTNPSTMVGSNVTVTYNFSPNSVPEPASLALVALGGLLIMTRRAWHQDRRCPMVAAA